MELLTVFGAIASICSLGISLFVASKVVKIEKQISVTGAENVVAGRDANVNR